MLIANLQVLALGTVTGSQSVAVRSVSSNYACALVNGVEARSGVTNNREQQRGGSESSSCPRNSNAKFECKQAVFGGTNTSYFFDSVTKGRSGSKQNPSWPTPNRTTRCCWTSRPK